MVDKNISAFAQNNRVPTVKGWKYIDTLTTNDWLFKPDGQPVKIKLLRNITSLGMLVTMSDGRSYICSEYAKLDEKTNAYEGTNYLKTYRNHGHLPKQFYRQPPKPAVYPRRPVPIHPYLMGMLCAKTTEIQPDKIVINNLSNQAITSLRERVRPHAPTIIQAGKTIIIQTDIKTAIVKNLKAAYRGELQFITKFVPRDYLTNSIATRKELLAGIIDTIGKPLTGCLKIENLSYTMRLDMLELVWSLGIPALETPYGELKLFSSQLPSHHNANQNKIAQIVPKVDSGKIRIHSIKHMGYVRSTQIQLEDDSTEFLIGNYIPVKI